MTNELTNEILTNEVIETMNNNEQTAEVLVSMSHAIVDGTTEMITDLGGGSTAVEVPVEAVPVKKVRKATKRRKTTKKTVAPVVETPVSFGSYAPVEEELGVIDQIRVAMKNPLAAFAGFILGGFVPVATYSVSHLDKTLNEYVLWTLVIGGLIYSALTVFGWAKSAFDNGLKALGFVVLIEGVMTLSGLPMLSYAALALLVVINGIATGANLSIKGSRVK